MFAVLFGWHTAPPNNANLGVAEHGAAGEEGEGRMMGEPGPAKWIILKCAGRRTIRIAEDLRRERFDVWTPVREVLIRKPRWNVHRKVRVPLMASFVFARSRHLSDLIDREAMPGAEFSVFRYCDRVALVDDAELSELRKHETAAATPDELRDLYRKGEGVSVTQGIFGGMAGVVERCDGTHTLVRFGTRMRVKISTFILQPTCAMEEPQRRKAA